MPNQVEIVDHYTRNSALSDERRQHNREHGVRTGAPEATARLTIETLGRFDVKQNGASIGGTLPIKTLLMVTYLACTPGLVARDDIRDLLWGGDRLTSGSTNLRVALSTVRRVLASTLEISRHSIGVAPGAAIDMDALAMEAAVTTAQHRAAQMAGLDADACRALNTGLRLYRGAFLSETAPANAPHFETWRKYQQAKFQALAHHGYALLTEQLLARGTVDTAIEAAERWHKVDELDELPYRTLIRLHAQMDNIETARQWYDTYRSTVFDALHLPPSEEMQSLHATIIDRHPSFRAALRRHAGQSEHDGERMAAESTNEDEARSQVPPPPHNLAAEPSTIYGRKNELALLSSLVLSGRHQLVTLVGADGIGKTCLAEALARRLLSETRARDLFRDGVFFIALEGRHSEAACLATLGGALGLLASALERTPLAQIEEYLAERRCLLILDGLELQAEQALFLAHLVAKTPGLSVIVTARQALGLANESCVQIQGLDIVSIRSGADDAASLPACRLFLKHAADESRPLHIQETNGTVTAICQLLEGIPLAIQLAAGIVRSQEIESLYAHLKQRLTKSAPVGSGRHERIVREVIAMAWQRLDPWLQRAYLRLAVFGDTFLGASASSAALVMPNQMAELQRASLVQAVPQAPTALPETQRYRLHPALRAFAAEALVASNAQDAAQRRHVEHFHRFIQQHDVTAGSQDITQRLDALDGDIDNLAITLRYAAANGSWEPLRNGALSMATYFMLRSSFAIAVVFFDDVRSAIPDPAPQEAVAALAAIDCAQAVIHNRYGHYAAAAGHARASLRHSHQDRELALVAHLELGRAGFFTADYAEARTELEQALHLAQVSGLAHWECRTLALLGLTLLYCGEHERGTQLSYAALHLSQKHRFVLEEGRLLNQLGMIFYYQGRFHAATQHYDHALRLSNACGDNATRIATTISLGAIAQQLGDYPRASVLYRDALRMMDACGDRGNEAIALANLGMALHSLNQNEEGLVNLARAESLAKRRKQRDVEAFVFTAQGHASFALGRLHEAEDCFGKALLLRQVLRQEQQAMEPLAGLAAVALTRGEVNAALAYAERMLPVIRSPWFAAAVEFFRVYWACYQALEANGDRRAPEVLTEAYHRLTARARQIEDESMRAGYVQRIEIHRAITDTYHARFGKGSNPAA